MHHIFIYALPTSQEKDARISEIAAVRVPGFGPYKKTHIQEAFFDTSSNVNLLNELYSRLIPNADPFIMVSYSKEVTRALLRIETEKRGIEDKFSGRAWLDIGDLAWPLLVSGQIKSRSIEALASHFEITVKADMDSADTVTALLQIYGNMLRRYSTALKGESMLREAGGETLAGLREIIGF